MRVGFLTSSRKTVRSVGKYQDDCSETNTKTFRNTSAIITLKSIDADNATDDDDKDEDAEGDGNAGCDGIADGDADAADGMLLMGYY